MAFEETTIGPCRMIRGDCLEVLPTLAPGSVDMLCTDPPYFAPAQHYATRKDFGRAASDLSILQHFFGTCANAWARIVHKKGRWFVFCDGQSYPLLYMASYSFAKSVRPLVWDKQVAFSGYTFRHQHELVLWADMPEAPPNPTSLGDVIGLRCVAINDREHPAEKPEALIQLLIRAMDGQGSSVKRANRICDPFMGGGAVAVASVKLERAFIGIEKEPKYFDIACRRVERAIAEFGLFNGVLDTATA